MVTTALFQLPPPPGQRAIDDVGTHQIAGVLNHVAGSHRAVEVEAAAVQIRCSRAVGRCVTTSEVSAALQGKHAVLRVQNSRNLIENAAGNDRAAGPRRFCGPCRNY